MPDLCEQLDLGQLGQQDGAVALDQRTGAVEHQTLGPLDVQLDGVDPTDDRGEVVEPERLDELDRVSAGIGTSPGPTGAR